MGLRFEKGDTDYVVCILYLYTAQNNKKIIQKKKASMGEGHIP